MKREAGAGKEYLDTLTKEGVEIKEFGFSGVLGKDGEVRVLVYFDDRWRSFTIEEAAAFCKDLAGCVEAAKQKKEGKKPIYISARANLPPEVRAELEKKEGKE